MTVNTHALQNAINIGCMKAIKSIDTVIYVYLCYKQWYYLGTPIVSDTDYDSYEDMIKKEMPDNPALDVVGLMYPKCKCCSKKKGKK